MRICVESYRNIAHHKYHLFLVKCRIQSAKIISFHYLQNIDEFNWPHENENNYTNIFKLHFISLLTHSKFSNAI